MKKFKIVKSEIIGETETAGLSRIAMISDLHNVELGKKNEHLLQALQKAKPDIICIAGDLVLGKKGKSMNIAYEFIKKAVKIAPIYYGLGNHEQSMKKYPEVYGEEYRIFEKRIQKLGVTMLENNSSSLERRG